jgi:hypothetical protein
MKVQPTDFATVKERCPARADYSRADDRHVVNLLIVCQ